MKQLTFFVPANFGGNLIDKASRVVSPIGRVGVVIRRKGHERDFEVDIPSPILD